MKTMLRFGLCWICVTLLTISLSGCQLFDIIWPQKGPVEISEALPEIPDEVLKEAAELEEAAEFFESITGEEPPLTTRPIGRFTLNYFLNYKSEFLNVKSSLLETITLTPDLNQKDYTKAIYYFNESFPGKQTGELAGMDMGVICWAMFEHQVEYHVQGNFDPTTCTLKVTIDAEPLKTVETGSYCPDYVTGLLDFPQLFIATPDKELTITKTGTITTFDVWNQLLVRDFQMPVAGINCPME